MFDKTKDFFANTYSKIVAVLGVVVGILIYIITLKSKQNNALKAKVELANTQKQADLLEVEIKQKLENNTLLKKEVADLNNALVQLDQKRKSIEEKEKNLSPKEAEDYWNDK